MFTVGLEDYVNTVINDDCLHAMVSLPDDSIDSIVTDPPYGLSFMGKDWDHGVPGVVFWQEALRIAKPGCHLLAFGGTRTFHRLAVAIEDAGWEIRDTVMWVYGCLSDDTEILTDSGWKRYDAITCGSMVMCYNVGKDSLEFGKVEEVFTYEISDTAYRIQSDNTDQIVTKDHRCLVERGGEYVFQRAATLQREETVPVLESVPDVWETIQDEQQPRQSNAIQEQQPAQEIRSAGATVPTLATVTQIHYDGIVWCARVPTGAFVARRNGHIFVTGNSGFPKSLNIGKAIDKAAGAERKIVGKLRNPAANKAGGNSLNMSVVGMPKTANITTPATDAAKQWEGWGTALKPAWEPVIVARKPIEGTVANNVLKWGTGGINIDGCRVGTSADMNPADFDDSKRKSPKFSGTFNGGKTGQYRNGTGTIPNGRFPANLIHSGEDEVVGLFPDTKSGVIKPYTEKPINPTSFNFVGREKPAFDYADSGSASRFFYCAKASKSERNMGCEGLEYATAGEITGGRKEGSDGLNSPRAGAGRTSGGHNTHPTVKPLALMRYLVRLVTPPDGVVLDPFCGSGSTLVASLQEGFKYIGIEKEPEYVKIAYARTKHALRELGEVNEWEVCDQTANQSSLVAW